MSSRFEVVIGDSEQGALCAPKNHDATYTLDPRDYGIAGTAQARVTRYEAIDGIDDLTKFRRIDVSPGHAPNIRLTIGARENAMLKIAIYIEY